MPRYRNNLCVFYCCLVDHYGFNPADIQVVYNNDGVHDFGWHRPVGTKVATLAHAQAAITNALTGLSDEDLFVLYTTNHGDVSGRLELWGATEYLTLAEMARLLAGNTQPYYLGVFGHCFSRAMAARFVAAAGTDAAGRGKGAAVSASDSSSSALPPDNVYDAFVHHFTTGLQEKTPSGHPVPSDMDGDGEISLKDAYDFTVGLASYVSLRAAGGMMKDNPDLIDNDGGGLAPRLTLRGLI